MRRREFVAALGSAAAVLPSSLRGQQSIPIIGFLHSGERAPAHDGFGLGLSDMGFVVGRNVTIEWRYAAGHYDRLPTLAADLVRLPVDVLCAAGGAHTAVAAKSATASLPIVFAIGSDPVRFGLVASLARPGGNITGVSFFAAEVESKRLGILKGLLPEAAAIGALINPRNANADNQAKALSEAARGLGIQLHILQARNEDEFEAAFSSLLQQRANALIIASDPFFFARRQELVALAAHHRVAAIYEWREFVQAGGLMSYGTDLSAAYRQAGLYTGRVLRGAKPGELPVMRTTKFEFVINLNTARALGLTVPNAMQLLADEVIE